MILLAIMIIFANIMWIYSNKIDGRRYKKGSLSVFNHLLWNIMLIIVIKVNSSKCSSFISKQHLVLHTHHTRKHKHKIYNNYLKTFQRNSFPVLIIKQLLLKKKYPLFLNYRLPLIIITKYCNIVRIIRFFLFVWEKIMYTIS